ncbi:MAG: hypothetical protein L0H53_15015, partial [Candidatus Nitrosocosmicus sp.]|nr:hypothetical protein [Candidatus Nitrosocosmicus sp.]
FKINLLLICIGLPIALISLFNLIPAFTGIDSMDSEVAFAQNPTNIINIISTSTYIDDFGNFHIIGEVNNTSFDPQTNIIVTTILLNSSNNIVGNHSAFSSIGTLRPGELSPLI